MAVRLALSGDEFALLAERAGGVVPAWYGIGPGVAGATDDTRLREVGVLDGDGRPVPSVAANLAVLTAPAVAVRTEVSVGSKGLISVHTVSGELGASLITLDGGAVELTLFAATGLGAELVRAVPPRASASDPFADAFGPPEPLAGELPLTALQEFAAVAALSGRDGVGAPARDEGMTRAQTTLAAEVNRRTRGVLWSMVVGHVARETAVGQLVWLATDGGWVGLRPMPDRLVELRPVEPADLAAWLAPDLASLLDSVA